MTSYRTQISQLIVPSIILYSMCPFGNEVLINIQCQAITWTNADCWLIVNPSGNKSSEIWMKI